MLNGTCRILGRELANLYKINKKGKMVTKAMSPLIYNYKAD